MAVPIIGSAPPPKPQGVRQLFVMALVCRGCATPAHEPVFFAPENEPGSLVGPHAPSFLRCRCPGGPVDCDAAVAPVNVTSLLIGIAKAVDVEGLLSRDPAPSEPAPALVQGA